jgi:putative membrane protein
VLLLGGTYEAVVEAVGLLTELVIHWGALASTGIGAVLGIIIFSKLIDTAIKRAPAHAYYAVLGLIAGSVYGLWPDTPARVGPALLVLVFVAGVGIALLFGREPTPTQKEGADGPESAGATA